MVRLSDILKAFKYWTIWLPTTFWPFECQTSLVLVLRSPTVFKGFVCNSIQKFTKCSQILQVLHGWCAVLAIRQRPPPLPPPQNFSPLLLFFSPTLLITSNAPQLGAQADMCHLSQSPPRNTHTTCTSQHCTPTGSLQHTQDCQQSLTPSYVLSLCSLNGYNVCRVWNMLWKVPRKKKFVLFSLSHCCWGVL